MWVRDPTGLKADIEEPMFPGDSGGEEGDSCGDNERTCMGTFLPDVDTFLTSSQLSVVTFGDEALDK